VSPAFVASAAAVGTLMLLAVAFAARERRRSPPSTTAFACKIRVSYPPRSDRRGRKRPRWQRRRASAVWVHDVLLLRRGLLIPRMEALPVRLPEDDIHDAKPHTVRGLGAFPVVISLRLDDGAVVDVAAAAADRTLLAGPFLAAVIPGLGGARRERPNLGR
jgi:hypothetical protein